MFFVVGDVAFKLGLPEGDVGFWGGGGLAVFVAMPEATVNKDDGVVFPQDNVGFAGKVFSVQAEAVAGAVEQGAHLQLRFRILPADLRHVPRAFLWRQRIHGQSVGFAVLGVKS